MRRVECSPAAPAAYQLKVTLKHSKPPIWRRIRVAGTTTLAELHGIIQITMGWTNSHLHQFEIDERTFSLPNPEGSWPAEDEQTVTLGEVLRLEGQRFMYWYDFGDDWKHLILVEKILEPETGTAYPVCVTGRLACPPEDSGGVFGYYRMLEAISDPKHPKHEDMAEWIDPDFDPNAFDQDFVNTALAEFDLSEFGVPIGYEELSEDENELMRSALIEGLNEQMDRNDPRQIQEVCEHLASQGFDEEEIADVIGEAILTELFAALKEGESMDLARYIKALQALR